jgi:hypothetical protein
MDESQPSDDIDLPSQISLRMEKTRREIDKMLLSIKVRVQPENAK